MTGKSWEGGAAAQPVDSATVILIREGGQGPEVYLMTRAAGGNAFARAHVFPGGLLDPGDSDPRLAVHAQALDLAGLEGFLGPSLAGRKEALGLFFGAIRETFEEAGVLFASAAPRAPQPDDAARSALIQGRVALADLVEDMGLELAPGALRPFGRWITPTTARKRYDTRFFTALLPQGEEPRPDGSELTRGFWVRPAEAEDLYKRGELRLMPPTLMTLIALSAGATAREMHSLAAPENIRPVMPQPFIKGSEGGLLFPHDPDYGVKEFKQEPRPRELSRVVMVNNLWEARRCAGR